MPLLTALITGLLFGFGLLLSGMANPAKILGFLDIAGAWDPSLVLVMAAAVSVGFAAFTVAGRRTQSVLGQEMKLPPSGRIDRRLLAGSAVFGVGWGLAGFCPGPALVALGMGLVPAAVFFGAMLAGMAGFEFLERQREKRGAMSAAEGRSG
jgi:uncharacterized membrane protein YedE/YeeE